MKNLFSLTLVAFATLSMACGGNANRPAETAEEAAEDIVVVEEATEACCEEGKECDEACCEEGAEETEIVAITE